MSDRSPRVETIFTAALAINNSDDRDAFLDRQCGEDSNLRKQVEEMLVAHAQMGSFLQVTSDAPLPTISEKQGTQIGPYKLMEQIGEGGMGVVYVAEQRVPVRRRVALKIVKAGMDTKEVLARFDAERQALAMMDHPNIAKVLDAGATEAGRPYFVMELVKGVPITQYCDENQLSPSKRLDLFVDVCAAIQHAHQKGVIHRDIKPTNVLVASHDGKPVVKVIDFGVAKAIHQPLTEQTVYTQFSQMVGTPLYMSPEQAGMSSLDVDTRSDIYSLGVLLYELLTGKTPVDNEQLKLAAYEEMRRIIREENPPKPSTRISSLGQEATGISQQRQTDPNRLTQSLRGDLDWIVMKALEKDRTRRYETASGFADDIQRYLADEPVTAGPPGAAYRLQKFVRRNRGAVIAASLILTALIVGIAGTTYGMLRAIAAERVAQTERDQATRQARIAESVVDFLNQDLLASVDPEISRGRAVTVREVLDNAARSIDLRFSGQAETEAAIRNTLGKTYFSLGDYQESKRQLQHVAELDQGSEPTPVAMRTGALLTELLRVEGRYEEARSQIATIIKNQQRLLGANHRDTLQSQLIAAKISDDLADYDRAEEEMLNLVEDIRAALGEEHRDLMSAKASLGNHFLLRGNLEKAEETYRNLLQERRRILGEDHPDTLRSLGSVAACLWSRKHYAEAEALFREQLVNRQRVLGDEHPLTIDSMFSVASVFAKQNRLKEAENLHRKVLDLQTRLLGPEMPATLATINNLAVSLDRQGNYAEAKELYEQLLNRYLELRGPQHPKTLLAKNNTATMLAKLGQLKRAEALHRETLQSRRQVLGINHPQTMESAGDLLELLREDKNQWQDARPLQLEHLAYLERAAASTEAGLRIKDLYAFELLIAIPAELRDPVKAKQIIEDVLQKSDERIPQFLDTYAEALFQTGDIAKAIEVEREAIENAPAESTLRIEFGKRLKKYLDAAAAKENTDKTPSD